MCKPNSQKSVDDLVMHYIKDRTKSDPIKGNNQGYAHKDMKTILRTLKMLEINNHCMNVREYSIPRSYEDGAWVGQSCQWSLWSLERSNIKKITPFFSRMRSFCFLGRPMTIYHITDQQHIGSWAYAAHHLSSFLNVTWEHMECNMLTILKKV